jgi:AcrR family transcriptional regulator
VGKIPDNHNEQASDKQTRRRGAELEQAILDAAWEQLIAEGYEHFTIDTVAARARTSKPVLYRR